ncbi:MAG: aspartate kinase [Cyanobacteria bacterium P01_G01_bin.54]
MSLIVQKYGGTSVGSVDRIKAVAQRVQQTIAQDHQAVIVVSAMGKTTDTLVSLAQDITATPCRREMDMLLSTGEQVSIALLSLALQELGQPAISLTGAQVGIVTEQAHSRARILEIKPDRIERHLKENKVVVVAGFQGITSTTELEITTLGRGGSDTSAVALAVALGASQCEIYTDVPGILTTDPRIVPEAQLMHTITAGEMLELASLGATVLHPRAVELARNYGMPLVVRSSWTDEPGTRVVSGQTAGGRSLQNLEINEGVEAIEFDLEQARVALLRVPDRPGIAAKLFGEIAQQQVDVDLIIQSIHEGNTNDIAFTVGRDLLPDAAAIVAAIAPLLRSSPNSQPDEAEVTTGQAIAKISIVGAGMIGRPGIAAQMFQTLADAAVNIEMISTSEVKVSCLIAAEDCDRAIDVLCRGFGVNSSRLAPQQALAAQPVCGVALDRSQAELAIRHIPDRPGTAAQVFSLLAQHNVSVDMIIQSQRAHVLQNELTRDLACTIAAADVAIAEQVLMPLVQSWPAGELTLNPEVAKVSVVGAGMIGQPGIAARMFAALAEAQINIQMIATSEIKISCVVAQSDGERALKVIHQAFELGDEGAV